MESPQSSIAIDSWCRDACKNVTIREDTFDLNRARQLQTTMPDFLDALRKAELGLAKHTQLGGKAGLEEVQVGREAAYGSQFTLEQPFYAQDLLGSDGTEQSFMPPGDFNQRMWASGNMKFPHGNPLCVGDNVKITNRVLKVDCKPGRSGPLVFVTRSILYENGKGVVCEEERTHVFRKHVQALHTGLDLPKAHDKGVDTKAIRSIDPGSTGTIVHPTYATLFRFSAATFNAHRIHLDPVYARMQEDHPDVLVHGPLLAIWLANLAATFSALTLSANKASTGARLCTFSYRAVTPCPAGAPVTLVAKKADRNTMIVNAMTGDQTICTKAVATFQ